MAKDSVKRSPKDSILLAEKMDGYIKCTDCGRILVNANFYVSNHRIFKNQRKICVCKDCVTNLLVTYLEETEDVRLSIYYLCRALGFVYLENIYESSLVEAGWNKNFTVIQNGNEVWKKYIKTINSLKNYQGMSFEHGEQINVVQEQAQNNEMQKDNKIVKRELSEEDIQKKIRDKQNREDIVKIIGYDPFENERDEDKSYFYSRLIDMMTEDMQNDSMKLTSVISIIKSQKQIDKIDNAISEIMANPMTMVERSGDIKVLSATKKDIQKSILDTAKDNRITDLYSGQKTVGANTLSGIVKKLKELNLSEAQVNLYDIQTSLGMQQVAYLSTKAIVDQLNFAENEYADMVAFQRGQMQHYEKMYKQLAEENRRLKVLCSVNDIDYKGEVFVEATYEDDLKYDEQIMDDNKRNKEEFDEIVKSVLPLSTVKYAEKVIEENEKLEKEKILKEVEEE